MKTRFPDYSDSIMNLSISMLVVKDTNIPLINPLFMCFYSSFRAIPFSIIPFIKTHFKFFLNILVYFYIFLGFLRTLSLV